MPSKVIAGVVAVVGFAIMVGTAVPMSKEKDKTSAKYKGLIAGVVIGVLMLVAGIAMFFMGGGSNSNSNVSSNSNQAASAAAVVAQDPLNIASNAAGQAEMKATLNAQAANDLVNKTKGLKEDLAKMKGLFASLKPK
jgi:flagellar basal body-associated protein FliL